MIDTIVLRLPISSFHQETLIKNLSFVTFKRETTTTDGEHHSKHGEFKNFSVRLTTSMLIIEGSLSKYYFGNNVQTLSSIQITEALLRLKQDFGPIPILRGHLSRIDIADCFILKSDIQRHFSSLRDTPKFERNRDKYGVRYKYGNGSTTGSRRELAFYKKTKQALKEPEFYKHLLTPDGLKEMIRIELRYKKQARKQLMRDAKKLMGVQLLSISFQEKLVQQWASHYHQIIKAKVIRPLPELKDWVECKNYLAGVTLSKENLKDLLFDLDDVATKNNWSSRKKSDIKKNCLELRNSFPGVRDNLFVKELNEQVEIRLDSYLASLSERKG